jgi:exo-beta-1,3-glucanase (GH17 family)
MATAISFAKTYPDIVKIIAVGNEAMVKWATSYYVQPGIILKWVNHIQTLKKNGELSKDLWVTSSDNFASWGGGGAEYHVEDLTKLIHAVDFISMHTYPMHDTHYNPEFWEVPETEMDLSKIEKINRAMLRSKNYAISQYESVVAYMKSVGADKPVHIGETGWASSDNALYGKDGSKATDEYKQGLFYQQLREWTNKNSISCFYFEAFDEHWKDAKNPEGSENHFGLINLQGEAKYPIWSLVDEGRFNGLTRNGKTITKTYSGDLETLMQEVKAPLRAFKNKEVIEVEE